MSYDTILVPLDGSLLSEHILPHVETVARAFGAQVVLLHVLDGRQEAQGLTPSQRKARADISRYLERVTQLLEGKRLTTRWLVSFGEPAQEIVRHALREGADLVMMSTHGQGGRRPEGVGSVAQAVVSAVTTPVMLIRPPEEVAHR